MTGPKKSSIASLAAIVVGLMVPTLLAAQATVTSTVAGYTGFVSRGLTYTNRPVLNPAVEVSIPAGAATVTLTGFGNVELGKYNRPSDLSQGGGSEGPDLAELDLILELSVPVGRLMLDIGSIGYLYPNDRVASPVYNSSVNTFEVYGRIGIATFLSPTVAAYYDLAKIKGAYFEASLAQTVAISPKRAVRLGAIAAFSAGQSADRDVSGQARAAVYNFDRDGLTHLDLFTSVDLPVGTLTVSPVAHLVLAVDPLTQAIAVGRNRNLKLWAGASISWARRLAGQRAETSRAPASGTGGTNTTSETGLAP